MKSILGILSLVLVVFTLKPSQDFQSRYRRVEAYEIRPGILAIPTYAGNGLLCKVAVEKRHIQADVVEMVPTIPRKLTQEIIDDLAPASERGPRTLQSGPFDYDIISGSVAVLPLRYENVSVEISRDRSYNGDTAIILTWDRNCGPAPATAR